MSSRFLKSFFTTFFAAFDNNQQIVEIKKLPVFSPSSVVYQLASEKILMGFVNALEAALKANLRCLKSVTKSSSAMYYSPKSQESDMSTGRSLLVDLNQFHAPTAKKLENLLEPSDQVYPDTLRDNVNGLLARLNEIDISDELEENEKATSSYKIKVSVSDFSKLDEIDPESPTKIIAKFGLFILEKLTEIEKIPTNKFGGNSAEVIMKYTQELLVRLKEKAACLCPGTDKKACVIM